MSRKLILLIDDDEDIRNSVTDLLTICGYDVIEAENGKVALEVLSKQKSHLPGLIILDLMMPVMDGKSFMDYISQNHQDDFAKIPLIVFTANSSYPAENAIPMSYKKIRKPFEVDLFLNLIEAEFSLSK
jgi:two-component system chemotaxis response regulator CheY